MIGFGLCNGESTRILFGSCNKHYKEQPLWPMINDRNPDLWIWGGDIVYHDRPNIPFSKALWDFVDPSNTEVDTFHYHRIGYGSIRPTIYDAHYQLQNANEGYSKLRHNNKTQIIGIWDDHDYGLNDGNRYHPYKEQSKASLMKFLQIPRHHPMRDRDGFYQFHSFTFGDDQSSLVVDVYLIDVRWFSDPKHNILFGDEQWKWFNSKIKERSSLQQSNVSLFVSGVQILPKFRGLYSEAWSGKSNEDRIRFLETILDHNVRNPILVSGDVHYGEQMRYNCWNRKTNRYESLYEITSSGLTHSWSHSYSSFLNGIKQIIHWIDPDGALIDMTSELNFGEIEIVHGEEDDASIQNIFLRVHGLRGVLLEIDLMDGQYRSIDDREKDVIRMHENDDLSSSNDWICVGKNEPKLWISRLYVVIIFGLIFCTFASVLFTLTGFCFCGFCCCCCRCLRAKSVKLKQS